MGLLGKLKDVAATAQGNMGKRIEDELNAYLLNGETIESTFQAKEDFGCITNKRLIFMDNSLTSSKKAVIAVPFSKITYVGLSRGGFMSFSKDVIVTIGSHTTTIDTYSSETALGLFKAISEKIS